MPEIYLFKEAASTTFFPINMAKNEQRVEEKKVLTDIMSVEAMNEFRKKFEAMNEFRKKFESKEAISEVTMKQAECECCGLKEECTEAYITKIERSHSGKWVCGLCSEAVKETMKRSPETAVKEAVSSHRDFCNKYNSTTRLNPKLSFTCDMRNIAKRSCESRITNKLARSSSCVPRFDLHQYINP